jgi:hypothetical protein
LSRGETGTAEARIRGSCREHDGSLKVQAELFRAETGEEPFSFNLSGRTGEAGLLVVELATLIGEALEQSFLPQIRPPLFSTPAYLLALDKPVFAPLAVFDGREEDGGGILRACSPPIPGPPWPM